jgi:hypothetical protein
MSPCWSCLGNWKHLRRSWCWLRRSRKQRSCGPTDTHQAGGSSRNLPRSDRGDASSNGMVPSSSAQAGLLNCFRFLRQPGLALDVKLGAGVH